MFDIDTMQDLSDEEEIAVWKVLIDRQNKRVEEKAKARSEDEFVSSYLERPFIEEERMVTHGDKPTSTKKYEEDELRWHRGDVTAATMAMMDVCDATETLTMLQGLCRFVANSQVNTTKELPDGLMWSDVAEEILSC
jgi:hypothetical protein